MKILYFDDGDYCSILACFRSDIDAEFVCNFYKLSFPMVKDHIVLRDLPNDSLKEIDLNEKVIY